MSNISETEFQDRVNFKAIEGVVTEIDRQKKARRDFIYPASLLAFNDAGQLVFGDTDAFQVVDRTYTSWKDAEAALDAAQAGGNADAKIVPLGKTGSLPLSRTAIRQLCDRAGDQVCKQGYPIKLYDALRDSGNADINAMVLSQLLKRANVKFLVRTLDGNVRAVLSDKYKVLDNGDLFFAAAESLQNAGAKLWNARLWDDGFEMFAVSPSLHAEVKGQFDNAGGSYHHVVAEEGGRDFGKPNVNVKPDIHNALVRIRNSETGCGGLSVSMGMLRRACNNTLVLGKALSCVHLGGKQAGEGEINWAEDTRSSESQTIWLKIRDTIKTAFDKERFEAHIAKLNGLKSEKVASAEKAVAAVAEEYKLSDARRASILQSLFEGRDISGFGVLQAITVQAHDAPAAEASELEEIGGKFLEMSKDRRGAMLAAV